MKTLLTTVLAIWLSASALSTLASEKIDGAFGKKFGEIFEPSSALGTSKLSNGEVIYEFATTNGIRSFNHYYALITPITHKIYGVYAIGGVENTMVGRKEQSVIMGILREKYGPEFEVKIGPVDSMGDVKRISQGTRHIVTMLNGSTDMTIDIKYYEEDLEKLAEKERVAKQTATMDKSGL